MAITSITTDHLHQSCPITLNCCHIFPLQFTKHIFRSCQVFPHSFFSYKKQIKEKIKKYKDRHLSISLATADATSFKAFSLPCNRNAPNNSQEFLNELQVFYKSVFPWISHRPARAKSVCLYTYTTLVNSLLKRIQTFSTCYIEKLTNRPKTGSVQGQAGYGFEQSGLVSIPMAGG